MKYEDYLFTKFTKMYVQSNIYNNDFLYISSYIKCISILLFNLYTMIFAKI